MPTRDPAEHKSMIRFLMGVFVALVLLAAHYETASGGSVHMLMPRNKMFAMKWDSPLFEIDTFSRHQRRELSRGPHYIAVSDGKGPPSEYGIEIGEGSFDVLVPVDSEQCFVKIELSRDPRIVERNIYARPLSLEGVTYVGLDALPKDPRQGALAVAQVECRDVTLVDAPSLLAGWPCNDAKAAATHPRDCSRVE